MFPIFQTTRWIRTISKIGSPVLGLERFFCMEDFNTVFFILRILPIAAFTIPKPHWCEGILNCFEFDATSDKVRVVFHYQALLSLRRHCYVVIFCTYKWHIIFAITNDNGDSNVPGWCSACPMVDSTISLLQLCSHSTDLVDPSRCWCVSAEIIVVNVSYSLSFV